MTHNETNNPDFTALANSDVELDALFDVLSDSRRRFILTYLQEHDTPMALMDVVDELATWEHEADITDIPAKEVSSISISLYHRHLPKMADAGIVEYTREGGAEVPTENSDELISLVSSPPVE